MEAALHIPPDQKFQGSGSELQVHQKPSTKELDWSAPVIATWNEDVNCFVPLQMQPCTV